MGVHACGCVIATNYLGVHQPCDQYFAFLCDQKVQNCDLYQNVQNKDNHKETG
uniref:Uncharacterized protein n=1 Tax=Anguilla anguilla TaxID=7936 RepID=A0A0E9VQI0_ANGAN